MKEENLLLIIPKFFSYEKYIKNELEKIGYKVCLIYENADEFSSKSKFFIRLAGSKKKYFEGYYTKLLKNKSFDIILAIRASSLCGNSIKEIRKNSPNAKFYMYQWDSVKNNPNAVEIAPYFERVSTFDLEDAKKYGWNYRPLFYIEPVVYTETRKYDLAYICTLHSQRVKIFRKLKETDCIQFLYMYSKFSHFVKERYFNRNTDFSGVSLKNVRFKSLSLENSNEIMAASNIVVDYTHLSQTGFTMRTCEAIGHRCKLVTNNKLVKEADFYNENNVYIYDVDNFQIPESFINSPYQELSKEIYDRYSISNWIKEIINYE